jgi:hypothetical protein
MLLRSGWKMHKTRDRLRANSWVGGRPRTWKPGTGPAADDNLIREGGSFRRDQSENTSRTLACSNALPHGPNSNDGYHTPTISTSS